MSNYDIYALLFELREEDKTCKYAALSALIAERDALIADRTALIAECDGLRSDRKSIWQINREQITELAAMREQRDEARRLHCVMISRESMNPKRFTPEWVAKQLGWDCFAQEGNGA